MSKILKNTTASIQMVVDTGVPIPASGQYTIPPTDYLLWAASNNVITLIGDGTLIVNDGSVDLSISDGTDYIKGIYQKNRIIGNTDGTQIGNVADRLKVDAQISSGSVTITTLQAACNVIRQAEVAITVKVETDLAGSTYTVPAGKTFNIFTFGGSYDAQQPMFLRFKKQTGGVGAFVTIFKTSLSVNGQDASNYNINIPVGAIIGTAGDVFKLTYEPAVGRGALWAGYFGVEY